MLSLLHHLGPHASLAESRCLAPLSAFTSNLRLPPSQPARSVYSIVPYTMSKGLPPYMNIPTSEQRTTRNKPVLRMLLLGKPCSGKGTLATRLSEKYDISTLSTGDLIRQHISQRTVIGRQAERVVATGGLLPDEMMLDLITSKLETLKEKNWILDGFPRTQRQGRLLDDFLAKHGISLNLIINLNVPDDLLFQWVSDRWVHVPSGRVYSTSHNPPQNSGLDDVTGEPLMKRPDDNPETFGCRLEHYYAQTSPLLYYYASRAYSTRLLDLYGDSEAVWPTLETALRVSFSDVQERARVRTRLGRPRVRSAPRAS